MPVSRRSPARLAVRILTAASVWGAFTAHAAPPGAAATDAALRAPDSDDAFERLTTTESVNLDAIVSDLTTRLQSGTEPGPIHALLGRLYSHLGQCGRAVEHFRRAQTLLPRAAVGPLGLADCATLGERWNDATDRLAEAAGRTTNRRRLQDIRQRWLEAALMAERGEVAKRVWRDLVAASPRDIYLQTELAQMFTRRGRLELALEAWTALWKRAGRDDKLRVLITREMGAVLARLGRTDEAIQRFEALLKRLPAEHWSVLELYEGLLGAHRQAGTTDRFIAQLKKRKRNYPALLVLARVYEETGKDREALATYREAVRRRPANGEAQLAILRLLKRVGTPAELEAEYRKLAGSRAGDPKFDLELAELYFARGDKDAAFKQLEATARRYDDDPGALEAVAELYVSYGGPRARIEALYGRLQRLEPDREDHAIRLGEFYFGLNERDAALSAWRKVLRIVRDPGRAHLILARVYAEHDLENEAIEEYGDAIKARPKRLKYRQAFGRWLTSVHRYREAAEVWRQLLDRIERSDYPARYEIRGRLVDALDNHKMLRVTVRKWTADLAAKPNDPELALRVAAAHFHHREFASATQVLAPLSRRAPDHVEVLLYLQESLEKQGDIGGSVEVLDRLSQLDRGAALPRLKRMARLAAELQRPDDALRFARLVTDGSPSDPEAFAHLASIQLAMGKRAEAAVSFRRAVALGPDAVDVRLKYANLLETTGQYDELTTQLVEVARRARDPNDVLEIGRRVFRVPGTDALVKLEAALLDLTQRRPKQPTYRELLVEVYATWVRRTDLRGRTDSENRWLDSLAGRGLRPLTDALASQNLAARANALRVLYSARPKPAALSLARLLDEHDRFTQFQALVVLARTGADTVLPHVERLTRSREGHVMNGAVWALGAIGGNGVSSAIRRVASTSGRRVNLATVSALAIGARGDRSLFDLALRLHRSSKTVQPFATWALGALGDPRAVDLLLEQLATESADSEVALWALGALGDKRAVPALMSVALREPGSRRRVAVWALQRCMTTEPLSRQSIATAYLDLPLYDAASLPLGAAIPRLCVTPPVKRAPATERYAAVALPALLRLLKEGDAIARREAVLGLRVQGRRLHLARLPGAPLLPENAHDAVETALLALADNAPDDLRKEAFERLAAVGGARTVAAVRDLSADTPAPVVRAALLALAQNPAAEASDVLIAVGAAHAEHWSVRLALALALPHAKGVAPERWSVALRGLLSDDFASVRAAAIEAAMARGLPATLRPLVEQLSTQDTDVGIRKSARKLLARPAPST